jgi:chemotaxis protein MotB
MKMNLMTLTIALLLPGRVSKKKYQAQVKRYEVLNESYDLVSFELRRCLDEQRRNMEVILALQAEVEPLKKTSKMLIQQLTDMSALTKTQAESINHSIENINAKDYYIRNLQNEIARKDSLNLALVMSLKGALKDINDKDVEIKVEDSAGFISISDKLWFKSGSYEVLPASRQVLAKVATVLNGHPDIQFMVEGHTDNRPISQANAQDYWDLSVLRATSVVRILQSQFGVDARMAIAAGRSKYIPVAENSTDQGRALNRRTRIVILPQMDQFFRLLENQ